MKTIIQDSIHISESTLMNVYHQNISLSSNILNSYDVIRYEETSFDKVWAMISLISNFSCLQHNEGHIISLNIPIIFRYNIELSLLQPMPIILNDKTTQLTYNPIWILGNVANPTLLLNYSTVFQYCYYINNIYLCQYLPQADTQQNPCIRHLLIFKELLQTCSIYSYSQTSCISKTIGFNNQTFAHICQFGRKSWLLPIKITKTPRKFIQLTISYDNINNLNRSAIHITTNSSNNHHLLSIVVISAIVLTSAFYLTAWACILCRTFIPQYYAQ